MMTEVCLCIVLLATAALIGAKAAREVQSIVMDKNAQNTAKNEDTEEQKRKAQRAKREIENFMLYDGRGVSADDAN